MPLAGCLVDEVNHVLSTGPGPQYRVHSPCSCPFSHMYTSPAEKVLPTGYICNGMCAHVVVYEIIIAHKAVRLYNVCICNVVICELTATTEDDENPFV